jgi:hypothetical protein
MNLSDWIAGVSAVAAIGSVGVTIQFGRASMRVSRQAAESARQTVDEAAKMRAIEGDRRAEEREDLHMRFRPKPPAEIVAELVDGTPIKSLFGSITVQYGYRVKADAYFHGSGSTPLSISTLHPNQPADIHIEQWPPGRTHPVTKEIRFRFWPPLESDGVDVWTCSCGRPTGESMDGPGHWELTVPVVYNPPTQPATAPVPPQEPPRRGLFR